ncbi:MAG: PQQ-dependent sugar dehydrogenase, partial [Verrucomicrobiota bacterium]
RNSFQRPHDKALALLAGPANPARAARGTPTPNRVPLVASAEPSTFAQYYDVEDIPLPPGGKSVDGLAIMPDGRIVVTFYSGWVCFYDVKTKKWTTFAEGLHTPLGVLPLSNSQMLVMQMPELTLLTDKDGDGKADEFKTISDQFGLSTNYSEFAFGPVKDAQGNLFFSLGTGSNQARPMTLTTEVRGFFNPLGSVSRMTSNVPYRGWIMQVTPDGKTVPYASGLREPNGLGLDPQGRLFSIDNQGDWVGASALYRIEKGHFYGHAPDLLWREDFQGGRDPINTPVEELDALRTRAAVVFPYGDMSNSPTQPLWDTTGGKFGPFNGQVFLGEMNQRYLMRVMLEDVDGVTQGAVSPFLNDPNNPKFHRGNNRLAFDAQGGLWVGQTFHEAWTGEDGLQRITWKGVAPLEVSTMKLTDDGFELTFTRPVNPEIAGNPQNYAMKTYFYNYHEKYGSDKYDNHPVGITSAVVSADHTRVMLHLDQLEAWRMYDLSLQGMVSEDGSHTLLSPWVVYTVNHLLHNTPPPRAPLPRDLPNGDRKNPQYPTPSRGPGEIQTIGGPQNFKPLPKN